MTEFRAPPLKIVAPDGPRDRTSLRTPRWYRHFCDDLGRAVRAEQVTDRESAATLAFWHTVMLRGLR
jgi:hypothetical protein